MIDTAFVSLGKHPFGVVVGAVTRGDLVIVRNVVTCILKRRLKERIDPETIDAQTLDVIQLLNNAFQIADTVTVGIIVRLRIDLIKYRLSVIGPAGLTHWPVIVTVVISSTWAWARESKALTETDCKKMDIRFHKSLFL
jgi:hypothetical protein